MDDDDDVDASCTGAKAIWRAWKNCNGESPLKTNDLLEVILPNNGDDIRGLPIFIPLLP